MSFQRPNPHLASLVRELARLPQETEWVEFKVNNDDPQEIGTYISDLANSATLAGKAKAYLVWGIEAVSHNIVGTRFSPSTAKKGKEALENWLLRLLEPKINIQFFELTVDDVPVVLLEIPNATGQPVRFERQEFIRVGSYKQPLSKYPEKERALWQAFSHVRFESGVAITGVSAEYVTQLLDYPAYFDLMNLPLPESCSSILAALVADELLQAHDSITWSITNSEGKKVNAAACPTRTITSMALRPAWLFRSGRGSWSRTCRRNSHGTTSLRSCSLSLRASSCCRRFSTLPKPFPRATPSYLLSLASSLEQLLLFSR